MKNFSIITILTLLLTFSCSTAKQIQAQNPPKTAQETDHKQVREVDEIQTYEIDESIVVPTASEEAVERWKDQRFGLFIHWGPISQMGLPLSHSRHSLSHRPGGGEYKRMTSNSIEPEVYDMQYKTFNPTEYDPDYIVDLAKRAGMEYLVFTAKHHAGFSMFDSKVSDYDIINTPYSQDILKQLEQSCRKRDFDFGFYYSPRDWSHPDCDSENNHDRYIEFYKAQMDELLNNYGDISEIWFDGLGPGKWGSTSEYIMKRIRELHPDAMVNDRGGVGADFYTPEHTISQLNNEDNWEACHTTTGQWGYNPNVGPKSLKRLMEILLYTWGGGGNMLLNIGPMGNGALNPVEVERLEQIAKWWTVNGERSIRGTRGGPYLQGPWGVATKKDNKVYLHVFRWSEEENMAFPNLDGLNMTAATLLNGKEMEFSKGDDFFTVNVPKSNRERIVTTIELEFDDSVMDIEPLHVYPPLTSQATLTASNNEDELQNVVDADATTTWNTRKKNGEIWIEASFAEPVTIASVVAGRGDHWHPKNRPELQILDENGEWKTILKWKPKWETVQFLEEPITIDKIRLFVKGAPKYNLAEFELYAPF